MAIRAQGTFKIDNWDENEILETDGGSKIRNAKVQLSGLRGDGTFEAGLGPEGERSITLDVEI